LVLPLLFSGVHSPTVWRPPCVWHEIKAHEYHNNQSLGVLLRPRSFVGLLHLRPTGQRPPSHLHIFGRRPPSHLHIFGSRQACLYCLRHDPRRATSSSAQREDGRNSFGSPSAGFDPSSAHSARQLLGFSTQGRSHGLRLFYRLIVTGHLRPMCPLRRWPSASGLRHAVMAATGWFPPEGMLRHSALGGLRQPMPSARDARSRLRPAATTARRQPSSARTSSARG